MQTFFYGVFGIHPRYRETYTVIPPFGLRWLRRPLAPLMTDGNVKLQRRQHALV
jgi:hypothetical protein